MKIALDDMNIAAQFIFLPMAMKVIQLDINHIKNGPFRIKKPYISQLERMHTLASHQLRDVKKAMWDRKISVIKLGMRKDFTDYQFIINRMEMPYTYNNHVIKKNVKEILEGLMEKSLEGN